MKLTSHAFKEGEKIPRKYTCQGVDISPPLEISGVPKGTKSLALIVDDPDVPVRIRKDGLWVHWVLFNIPPDTTKIEEGMAVGTVGQNTGKENQYMGPCPPDREHRYFFKLYALNSMLKLPEGATKDELLHAMKEHVIAHVELMGRYEKS